MQLLNRKSSLSESLWRHDDAAPNHLRDSQQGVQPRVTLRRARVLRASQRCFPAKMGPRCDFTLRFLTSKVRYNQMMDNLLLEDSKMVDLRLHTLPKGSKVVFQPMKYSFGQLPTPKQTCVAQHQRSHFPDRLHVQAWILSAQVHSADARRYDHDQSWQRRPLSEHRVRGAVQAEAASCLCDRHCAHG